MSTKLTSTNKPTTEQVEVYISSSLNANQKLEAKVIENQTLVITNIKNPAIADLILIEFSDLIGLQVTEVSSNLSSLKIFSTELEPKMQDTDKSNRKTCDFEYFSKSFEQLRNFREYVLSMLWEFNRKKFSTTENDETYEHPMNLKKYEKKV